MKKPQDILNILKNRQKFIAGAVLMTIAFSIAISLVLPKKYQTHTELLVVQKQSDWSGNSFDAAQSAERVANVLAQVVPASSFLDRIIASSFEITDNFGKNPEERKENWQDTAKASVIKNTGIIELDVYATNKEQTKQISYAISDILMKKGDIYHGGGDRIEVKIFDKPITSDDPVFPILWINALIGAILGLGLGCGIAIADEKRKEQKQAAVAEKTASSHIENYSLLR